MSSEEEAGSKKVIETSSVKEDVDPVIKTMATSTCNEDYGDGSMESVVQWCSTCETHDAVVYCDVCKFNFCAFCGITHLQSEHKPKELSKSNENLSFEHIHGFTQCKVGRSTRSSSLDEDTSVYTLIYRRMSPKVLNLSLICSALIVGLISGPLIQLISDSCRIQYTSLTTRLSNSIQLQHKQCEKHIQLLMDELREIEDVKCVLEGSISSYDEAILKVYELERDIIHVVKDKASKLRLILQDKQNKKRSDMAHKLNDIVIKQRSIDSVLSNLNEIRKSTNSDVLLKGVSRSKELLDTLDSYKETLQPLPSAMNADTLLLNDEKMKHVDDYLESIFTVDYNDQGNKDNNPFPVAEWNFTTEHGGKDLSTWSENPVILKNIKYGLGPNNEPNGAVILPTSQYQSIVVMNPTSKLVFTEEMTFFIHIYIDGTEYGPLVSLFEYRYRFSNNACDLKFGGILVPNLWMWPDKKSLHVKNCGNEFTAKNVLIPKSWHKLAVTFSQSYITMYVNGEMIKRKKMKADLSQTQDGSIYMGRSNLYMNNGRISSAKFFDSELTEKQIKILR